MLESQPKAQKTWTRV